MIVLDDIGGSILFDVIHAICMVKKDFSSDRVCGRY